MTLRNAFFAGLMLLWAAATFPPPSWLLARADTPPWANRVPRGTAPTVEFIIEQNLAVNTITCSSWFIRGDFTTSNTGELIGKPCTSTGPIAEEDGIFGDFSVSVSIDGTDIHLAGCRLDWFGTGPGIEQYAINCVHF